MSITRKTYGEFESWWNDLQTIRWYSSYTNDKPMPEHWGALLKLDAQREYMARAMAGKPHPMYYDDMTREDMRQWAQDLKARFDARVTRLQASLSEH